MSEQTELLAALRFAVRGREIGAVHVNDHWTVIIETLKKAISPAGHTWRLVPDDCLIVNPRDEWSVSVGADVAEDVMSRENFDPKSGACQVTLVCNVYDAMTEVLQERYAPKAAQKEQGHG